MKSFLVIIQLHAIEPALRDALRGPEGAALQQWAEKQILSAAYVREDLAGAYLVIQAEDHDAAVALVEALPMQPYFEYELVPLEAPHGH